MVALCKVFHNCLRRMLNVGLSFPLAMMYRDLGVVSVQHHMAIQMLRFFKRLWPRENGPVVTSLNTWGRSALEGRNLSGSASRRHTFYRRVHNKALNLSIDLASVSRGSLNEEFAARVNLKWLKEIETKSSLRDFSAFHRWSDENPQAAASALPRTLDVSPYLVGSSHMAARRQATKFRVGRLPLNSFLCRWHPPAQTQAPHAVDPADYHADACLLCAVSFERRGLRPSGAPAETATHALWDCPCIQHEKRRGLNRAAAIAFATDGRQHFCPSSTTHDQALQVWHGFAPQQKTQCLMWLFSVPHCAYVSNRLLFAFGELWQDRKRALKNLTDE